MSKHSPLPWKRDHPSYYAEDFERIYCDFEKEMPNGMKPDIACYVRPANSHESLKRDVAELVEALESAVNQCTKHNAGHEGLIGIKKYTDLITKHKPQQTEEK